MLISSRTRWMRPRFAPLALGLFLAPLGAVLVGQGTTEPVRGRPASIAAADDTAASWGRRVETMERAGTLRLRSSVADTMIEGRVHDRFDQYVDGVRIFGAQLVRQRSAAGVETVFGSVFPDDLKIPTTPTLSAEDVVARVTALAGRAPIGGRLPELVVLPREDGTFVLTWLTRVRLATDMVALFLDARSGEEVWRYSLIHRQAAVGTGTGVLGDRKKLATRQASSVFLADDTLRPPTLITYDLKGNWERVLQILDGDVIAGPGGRRHRHRQHVDRRGQRRRPRLSRLHLRLLLPALRPPRHRRQQPRDPFRRPPGAARRSAVAAGVRHRQLPAQRVLVRRVRPARPGLHGVRRGAADPLLARRPELQLLVRRLRRRRARADARRHRVLLGPDLPERVRAR